MILITGFYQLVVDVNMLNTVKNYFADVSGVSPSSEQNLLCSKWCLFHHPYSCYSPALLLVSFIDLILFLLFQVARVFYYLSAATLQYVSPALLVLFSTLVLRKFGWKLFSCRHYLFLGQSLAWSDYFTACVNACVRGVCEVRVCGGVDF